MPIERVGRSFIEVVDEDGTRHVVRVNATQQLCDVDEMRDESYIMVGGRIILVRSPLDDLKEALEGCG